MGSTEVAHVNIPLCKSAPVEVVTKGYDRKGQTSVDANTAAALIQNLLSLQCHIYQKMVTDGPELLHLVH